MFGGPGGWGRWARWGGGGLRSGGVSDGTERLKAGGDGVVLLG